MRYKLEKYGLLECVLVQYDKVLLTAHVIVHRVLVKLQPFVRNDERITENVT